MIVITAIDKTEVTVYPCDSIQLTYNERSTCYVTEQGEELMSSDKTQMVLLEEKFTIQQTINFCCFYRFTSEDGSFKDPHISAFMGNEAELPVEIAQAKLYSELTDEQQHNFKKSLGVNTFEAV